MTPTIIVPGIGNSGPDHWQSLWENEYHSMTRFAPSNWDEPDLTDWLAALDTAIAAAPTPPILVAHSLGCLLAAHYCATHDRPIKGIFSVAPPDPLGPKFPAVNQSFIDVPRTPLRAPTLVAASTDDPYASIGFAEDIAADWQAKFINLGPLGHVNVSSGLGDWPAGYALFETFAANLPEA